MELKNTSFKEREVKLMISEFSDGLHSESQKFSDIYAYIKKSRTVKLFDIKLCIKELDQDIIVVEYAYLDDSKRGKGLYKKAMNTLMKHYKLVLHEPTVKWFREHIQNIEYEKKMKIGNKDYFIWGSEKDRELYSNRAVISVNNTKEEMLIRILKHLNLNQIGYGVTQNYNIAVMLYLLDKQKY